MLINNQFIPQAEDLWDELDIIYNFLRVGNFVFQLFFYIFVIYARFH